MLSWICIILAVGIVVMCNLAPIEIIGGHEYTFFRLLITTILLGWVSDIWRNREKIARKAAVLCLFGYYVWMSATDEAIKMSMPAIAVESTTFLCVLAWAIMRARGEKPCPK